MNPVKKPMPRLRQIREQKRRAEALNPERDDRIMEALSEGFTERQVAVAVGLSPGRISQIKKALSG